jgi:hypothetical protein
LLAKVETQRVLIRCAAAFGVLWPLVDVITAADDAEVTGEIRLLGIDGERQLGHWGC